MHPELKTSVIDFGSNLYFQSLALRDLVLRQPLGLKFTAEDLAPDTSDIHFIAQLNNLVVGVMILKRVDASTAKMRQVGVHPKYQQQNVGTELLKLFEYYCKQNEISVIELNARQEAIPFYLKNQYQKVGSEFIEVGITHIKMIKNL